MQRTAGDVGTVEAWVEEATYDGAAAGEGGGGAVGGWRLRRKRGV